MLTPRYKKKFPKILEHKRVRLDFAHPDFSVPLWNTIEQDQKDRLEIWRPIKNYYDVENYLKGASSEAPGNEILYIISSEKDPCIGTIHLHSINVKNYKLELGYWIAKKFEGQGFISESIEAIEDLLRKLPIKRIEITCHSDNKRSTGVAKNNNYLLEKVENGEFFFCKFL